MRIIANPNAGHGGGVKALRDLHTLLSSSDVRCEIIETQYPGQATEITRDLVDAGERRLIVLGGDGTISEVVNGLSSAEVELGILSVGTGNDVARSLGLPINDLKRGLKVISAGETRTMDVGWERDRRFVSVLGFGFPATVAAETNRMKRLKGSPAFFIAVYKALYRMKPLSARIILDDQTLDLQCTSVLIQNTPYTGGGLLMAPGAKVDDGLFDVVVVDAIGKLDLMVNFPKAYRGKHLKHPSFRVYRSSAVRIESPHPEDKMFDGDIYGRTPLEARVLAGKLKVIAPKER